jgi:hypothetical protein
LRLGARREKQSCVAVGVIAQLRKPLYRFTSIDCAEHDMNRNLEPLLIIALVVFSVVLKEIAALDAKYVVAAGCLLSLGYIAHLTVQYFQGAVCGSSGCVQEGK